MENEKRYAKVYADGRRGPMYKTRGVASRYLKEDEYIQEYEVVPTKQWIKTGPKPKDWIVRTEEAKLLYGR